MEHFLNEAMIDEFRLRLEEEEKSSATIDKYIRDVRTFFAYAGVTESINKTTMIAYKICSSQCEFDADICEYFFEANELA